MRRSFSKLSYLLLGACLCLPVVGCGAASDAVESTKEKAAEVVDDAVDGAKEKATEVVDDAIDSAKAAVGASDEKEGSDEKE